MCAFVCMTEQSCRCVYWLLTSAQSLQSVQQPFVIVCWPVGNAEFGKQTPVKAASVARRGDVLHLAVVALVLEHSVPPRVALQEGALPDVCGRMVLRHARDTLELHGSEVPLEVVEHPSNFLRSQVRTRLVRKLGALPGDSPGPSTQARRPRASGWDVA